MIMTNDKGNYQGLLAVAGLPSTSSERRLTVPPAGSVRRPARAG
jgi:hypothetical protein